MLSRVDPFKPDVRTNEVSMPKLTEIEKGNEYMVAALIKIREAVPLNVLYERIHGHKPEPMEEKRFYNRFRAARSNPGMGFLGVCVAHCPEIQDLSLAEIFSIEPTEPETK